MRRTISTAVGLVATCWLAVAGLAQEQETPAPATSELSGRLVDEDGRPLPGLVVRVSSSQGPGSGARSLEAVTDEDGAYTLRGIPPGAHGLHAAPRDVRGPLLARFDAPRVSRLDVDLARPARARVRIVGPEGAPVAGARIEGRWRDLSGRRHRLDATSGPDGDFVVSALGGVFEGAFRVEADGLSSPTSFVLDDFVCDVSGTTTWALTRGATVTGTVTGPDGAVGGATVELHTLRPNGSVRRTAVTDASGRYRFAGVSPGPFRVLAATPDLDLLSRRGRWPAGPAEPSWPIVPAEGSVTRDIEVVASARVHGVVRDESGAPLRSVNVSLPGLPFSKDNVSDAEGRYRLPAVPARERVLLQALSEGGETEVELPALEPGTSYERDIVIPTARLYPRRLFRVVAADGRVPSGLRASLKRAEDGSAVPARWRTLRLRSPDRSGTVYVFVDDPQGPVGVRVFGPGYETVEAGPFTATRGGTLPEVRVVPRADVPGRVLDAATGEPLAGAWLVDGGVLDPVDAQEDRRLSIVRAVTDEDGRFALPGRSDVEWSRIVVQAPGYLRQRLLSEKGVLAPTRLERGTQLTGQVRDESGEPVVGALVRTTAGSVAGRVATDAAGRFVLPTFGPRDVDLQVRAPPRRQEEFAWGDSGAYAPDDSDVRIRLPAARTLAGVVVGVDGRPLAGARVECDDVVHRAQPLFPVAVTGADGRFAFRPVAPGVHRLAVLADGYAPVTLDDVSSAPGLRIELRPLAPTRGELLAGDGTPLAATRWLLVPEDPDWPFEPGFRLRFEAGRGIPFDTDADGRFTVLLPEEGAWKLHLRDVDGWPTGLERQSAATSVRRADLGGTLRLSRLRLLRGRAVACGGGPVPGLIVAASSGLARLRAETDARGEFALVVTRDDTWSVEVDASEQTVHAQPRDTTPFVVPPRDSRFAIDVEVHVLQTLRGRLTTAKGRPVAGRRLRLDLLGVPEDRVFATTDAEGRFFMERIACGISTLRVVPPFGEQGETIDLGAIAFEGADEEIQLTLPE